MKSEFPADKQFLITQMVPCPKRLADMNNEAGGIGEVDVEDGWATLENVPGEKKEGAAEENEEMFDLDMATATVVEEKPKEN
jgi:hypothetical protein